MHDVTNQDRLSTVLSWNIILNLFIPVLWLIVLTPFAKSILEESHELHLGAVWIIGAALLIFMSFIHYCIISPSIIHLRWNITEMNKVNHYKVMEALVSSTLDHHKDITDLIELIKQNIKNEKA